MPAIVIRSLSLQACTALIAFTSFGGNAFGQLLGPLDRPTAGSVVAASQKLLTADWERGPEISARSTSTFGAAGSDDPALLLAYALNRLQQNRVREAKAVADEIATKHPNVLDAWMLKAWINALINNYDQSCVDIRSLKQKIAQSKITPETEKVIYRRLGRMIGYFQGPVKDSVNEDLLETTILTVAEGLSKETLALFNEHRDATLKKHDAILKQHGQKTKDELAKVQIENDKEAQNLEQQNAILAGTRVQLNDNKQQLQEEGTAKISQLQQNGASIERQLSSISSDIRATQRDLDVLYSDFNAIMNTPPRFRPSTFHLTTQIQNSELRLSQLDRDGVALSNQANSIRLQISQTQNAYNQKMGQIDKEIKKIVGNQKRIFNKLTRIAKGPKIANGKSQAMKIKATSLRTFDDISLELYRQQLLEILN
jgi:hypothetical protein